MTTMFFQRPQYGLRMLVKSPGFSLVAILSLALGIGAEHRHLQPGQRLLLRPLPVTDPAVAGAGLDDRSAQPGQPAALAPQFQGPARAERRVHRHGGDHVQPDELRARAGIGADPGADRDGELLLAARRRAVPRPRIPRRGGNQATPVAVISHGFWERSLGSDPAVVGKTITLNRTPYTVVGVAPKGFTGVSSAAGRRRGCRCRATSSSLLRMVRDAARALPLRVRAAEARRHRRAGARQPAHHLRQSRAGLPRRQQGTERRRRCRCSKRG